jgi:hypothetical protein
MVILKSFQALADRLGPALALMLTALVTGAALLSVG